MWTCCLLLTLQGSALMVAGQCEKDLTSSSLRLGIRSPRQRQHRSTLHSLCVAWGYITSECTCRRKRSRSNHRTRSCSQKEIRKELTIHSQIIHILSVQGPSGQPLSWVVGEPCIDPTIINVPKTPSMSEAQCKLHFKETVFHKVD